MSFSGPLNLVMTGSCNRLSPQCDVKFFSSANIDHRFSILILLCCGFSEFAVLCVWKTRYLSFRKLQAIECNYRNGSLFGIEGLICNTFTENYTSKGQEEGKTKSEWR